MDLLGQIHLEGSGPIGRLILMTGFQARRIFITVVMSLFIMVSSSQSSGSESYYGPTREVALEAQREPTPPTEEERIENQLSLLLTGTFVWILVHVLVFSSEEASQSTL